MTWTKIFTMSTLLIAGMIVTHYNACHLALPCALSKGEATNNDPECFRHAPTADYHGRLF